MEFWVVSRSAFKISQVIRLQNYPNFSGTAYIILQIYIYIYIYIYDGLNCDSASHSEPHEYFESLFICFLWLYFPS